MPPRQRQNKPYTLHLQNLRHVLTGSMRYAPCNVCLHSYRSVAGTYDMYHCVAYRSVDGHFRRIVVTACIRFFSLVMWGYSRRRVSRTHPKRPTQVGRSSVSHCCTRKVVAAAELRHGGVQMIANRISLLIMWQITANLKTIVCRRVITTLIRIKYGSPWHAADTAVHTSYVEDNLRPPVVCLILLAQHPSAGGTFRHTSRWTEIGYIRNWLRRTSGWPRR